MVVCSQNGIEPSEECYKICVISHRCGALKYWKKHNTNAMDADPLDKMMPYLWRLNNWIDKLRSFEKRGVMDDKSRGGKSITRY
jgi:hypothetical protein